MDPDAPWPEGLAGTAEGLAEAAGDGGRAVRAVAFRGQVVAADVVPVADDQRRVAARAEGGAALAVMDVAGEDVMKAGVQRDAPGLGQRRRRGRRYVAHPPIRVERWRSARERRGRVRAQPRSRAR